MAQTNFFRWGHNEAVLSVDTILFNSLCVFPCPLNDHLIRVNSEKRGEYKMFIFFSQPMCHLFLLLLEQFFFLFWIWNQCEEPIETLSNLLFLSLWFTILLLVFSHHNVLFFVIFSALCTTWIGLIGQTDLKHTHTHTYKYIISNILDWIKIFWVYTILCRIIIIAIIIIIIIIILILKYLCVCVWVQWKTFLYLFIYLFLIPNSFSPFGFILKSWL